MSELEHFKIERDALIAHAFSHAESKIIYTEDEDELAEQKKLYKSLIPASAVAAAVKEIIIPLVVEHIPKLFYNPEDFIKVHFANKSFIENPLQNDVLSKKGTFTYCKKIFNTEHQQYFFAFTAGFKFVQLRIDGSNTMVDCIQLTEVNLNRSIAKLRTKNDKINLNIEIIVQYIDKKHRSKSVKLSPYLIFNVQPSDESNIGAFKGEKMRILPKMHIVTGLQINVTEINADKKNMDKWLELYNNNQTNITATLQNIMDEA